MKFIRQVSLNRFFKLSFNPLSAQNSIFFSFFFVSFKHLQFITYCYFTATVVRGFIWKVRRYIHACLTWADVRDYFTFVNILIVQIFHLGKFCLSNTFFKGSSLGSRLVNFSFIFVSFTITEGTLLFRENFLWSSACPLNGGFTE